MLLIFYILIILFPVSVYSAIKFKTKLHNNILLLVGGTLFLECIVHVTKHQLKLPYFIYYNIAVIFIALVWFKILVLVLGKSFLNTITIFVFFVFAFCNLFFFQGQHVFNNITFLGSSLLYSFLLLYNIYINYNNNKSYYISKNNLILLSSALIYNIGFSLVIAVLPVINLQTQINLYKYTANITNLLYYGLIFLYLILERKK
jgi:hypothetical protein